MSEEVNKKNILAIHDYSKQTRDMFRELQADINNFKIQNDMLKSQVSMMQIQIQNIQIKLAGSGATT